ncbi:hypothetical protein C8N43_1220 [Litoreibacter ponti]|uniref:Uncharacterized protein n=1 Tax=Litoreibacter ponti TaxID=1510457 RepID=A0A2T6BKH6_9RHOB|nr:DUF5337 family protein [Litoreibacter ponti]PTX56561.1 hypothetical protein C8N43_1220 [Litoreibacter ponti]
MRGDAGDDAARAAKGRKLAIMMIAAAAAFMAVEFAGATFGWSNQIMGLLELGIAAVFVWVMIEAYRLWRSRDQA